VYCLESPDLPQGVRVQDVIVPIDTKLTPRYDADLLGGVEVVEANVLARPSGDWSAKLYRPVEPATVKKLRVRFVPYYAWSNRGPSEMSVWVPAQ
jgi:DUF1680 family protein